MGRKLGERLADKVGNFVQYEIVKGYVILLDKADLAGVSSRHWYIAVEKKCGSRHFTTNLKLGYRRYRKVTLQSFLLSNAPGSIAKLIDTDSKLDYRRSNLTVVCSKHQSQALGKRKGHCTSVYKGVSYREDRDKWAVMIKCPNGKHKLVGYFDREHDAAVAYNRAALKYFGEHAFQNEIKCESQHLQPLKVKSKSKFRKLRKSPSVD